MSQHSRISRAEIVSADALPPSGRRPHSLVLQVASKMVLWACVSTLIITALGYMVVSQRVEQSTLSYLSDYLTQRLRLENQVFRSGQENLSKVERQFMAEYANPKVLVDPGFDAFFEPKSDGSLRLRDRYFDGSIDNQGILRSGVSGFLAKGQPSAELQRRLVLGYHVVAALGPAWKGQFANLYLAAPENGGVVYWPEVPWGRSVAAKEPTSEVGKRAHSGEARSPWWSPLYFDAVAKVWNVTYLRPIRYNGRVIMTAGHDILLDDLMSRLVHDHPVGAYNMVLRRDGELIAHPERLDDLQDSHKGSHVRQLGDENLVSIYNSIHVDAQKQGSTGQVRIFENKEIDSYVAYGEIDGPGWWFVTVYPRSLVLSAAREAANGLLILGLGSFAIMTLIVIWVLRERVSRPISQMKAASESVSNGDYEAVAKGSVALPEAENNEIGVFASTFKSMAKKVGEAHRHLEETVLTRTVELELANRELQDLSFRDGLTGAYNRRCFDRDLSAAAKTAHEHPPTFLLLCDIDHFKLYNDTYGHPAGDSVLCAVVKEMMRAAPQSRVYRYGGEEIAVLIRGSTEAGGRALARGIVAAVANLKIPHERSSHEVVTVSGGLTAINSLGSTGADDLALADARLYKAKSLGRNQLVDQS